MYSNSNKSFSNFFSAIIPHAGEKYAGQARKKIFDYILKSSKVKIKYIIYIASIHNIPVDNEGVYLLYKDFDIGGNFIFKEYPSDDHEHSYEWVKDELDKAFPYSKRIIIGPISSSLTSYKDLSNDIANFILDRDNSQGILLLGTTDLIHYGHTFNNYGLLEYPERQSKIQIEEDLIMNMIQSSYRNIEEDLSSQRRLSQKISLACGPYAIEMFTHTNSLIFKKGNISSKTVCGNVLDYYDSSVYDKKGIDKYVIYPKHIVDSFVSYVSIIYDFGDYSRKYPFKNGIDDDMALGFVKSILLRTLTSNKYLLELPKFHSFHRMRNGVFVGTSLDGIVNSCYGRFEQEGKSLENNIIHAAKLCVSDSIERWNNPITLSNVNKLQIKIDILDERKDWRTVSLNTFLKEFIVDGSYGVYLTLPNGSSATYLPSVAYDYKGRWTSKNYITNLTQKAGGGGSEWKDSKSKIQLYNTKTIESL